MIVDFSGGGKTAKNRAKQPGTLPFAPISTGLKTDPGAFQFCQIELFYRLLKPFVATPNQVRRSTFEPQAGQAIGGEGQVSLSQLVCPRSQI